MDDSSFRTREQEEAKAHDSHKVHFDQLALTALMIATAYQMRSPETIRKNLQTQWVKIVTDEVKKNPRYRDAFDGRRRGESRKEYNARRMQQAALRDSLTKLVPEVVADLRAAQGDRIYRKEAAVNQSARETVTELIREDYQGLSGEQAKLSEAIAEAQTAVADKFMDVNDRNNRRYKDLPQIQAAELSDHQAKIVTRRSLKEDFDTATTPEAKEQVKLESQITQKTLSKVLSSHDLTKTTEEEFLQLFKTELNRELFDRRGHKRYKIDKLSEEKILKISRYYSHYFQIHPLPAHTVTTAPPSIQVPKVITDSSLSKQVLPGKARQIISFRPVNFGSWFRFSLPRIDFSGLFGLFRQNLPSAYEAAGNGFGNLANFLGRLPGLNNVFGTGGGSLARQAAGKMIGKQAAKMAASQAGRWLAASTVEIWGPIVLIGGLVLILILVMVLFIFNNPVAQPYAVTQMVSPVPIASGAPQPTISPKPPYKTAGESLEEVMATTAELTCTPLAMVKAISRREASTVWSYTETEFGFYNGYDWWNSENTVDREQICRGFGYNTCTNEIPTDSKFGGEYCKGGPVSGICVANAEVMGAMQFEKGTWNGYKAKVEQLLSENYVKRPADRRVILDAFLAGGLKLHNDSGATDCNNWTPAEIEKAAGRYYGKCQYTIGGGGNYCREVCDYYNEYSDSPVDCSQIKDN